MYVCLPVVQLTESLENRLLITKPIFKLHLSTNTTNTTKQNTATEAVKSLVPEDFV